jgi:Flp pilus assembly protein TadB
MLDHVAVFAFAAVGALSLFSFLAVASWADARRKEREAYYKSETLKKIAESQGAGATATLELMRDEEKRAAHQLREGQKLGGLITLAVGIALMIFLRGVTGPTDKGVFLVGLIPALIGVALLVHSYFLAPKE